MRNRDKNVQDPIAPDSYRDGSDATDALRIDELWCIKRLNLNTAHRL